MRTIDLTKLRRRRGYDADNLWALVVLLAVKDGASAVCFDASRGDRALTYVIDGTEYEMVPPPEERAAEIGKSAQALFFPRPWWRAVVDWLRGAAHETDGTLTAKTGEHQVLLKVSVDAARPRVVIRLSPDPAAAAAAGAALRTCLDLQRER
jgi:hypothetical protein